MIIISIFFGLGTSIIWGVITKTLNNQKGYSGGFWVGFFFRLLGLILILVKEDKRKYKTTDYSSTPLGNLARYEEEQNMQKILQNGGWKCTKCGRVNSSFIGTCGCGMVKSQNTPRKVSENMSDNNASSNNLPQEKNKKDLELLNIQKLKSYKDLLDAGVITQEEFDRKKAELLK